MADVVTVLVVEDEAIVRVDIADQLSDTGFVVLEAANADEAIVLLETNPAIRLIFTDVDMPGSMDGLRLAAAVADRWPPVRIIVTSGHRIVSVTDMPNGSVFFSKPYRSQDIVTSMQKLLRDLA